MHLVPCRLAHLLIEECSDSQVIFLNEIDGDRRLAINIGPLEALAIDRAIKKQSFPRPLTHDLIVDLLACTQSTCIGIRITDSSDGVFYATIIIQNHDGSEHSLDCRPSDAIALLVRLDNLPTQVPAKVSVKVPLYVAESVLADAD